MNEWDKIAAEADKDLPARIGWLQNLYERGVIKRYLFFVEWNDENDEIIESLRYTDGEPIWAVGAAHHVARMVEDEWEEVKEDA